MTRRGMLTAVAVAAVLSLVTMDNAEARWWGWGSHSSGGWGSASSGGWGGYGSGSWGWGRGHHRGWHHRRAYWGSHSSGGWGSHSGGYWGTGWGSSSSGGGVIYDGGAPVYQSPARPLDAGDEGAPPAPPEGAPGEDDIEPTSVRFTVNVPADAIVYVNGKRTNTLGTSRNYVSRNLSLGRSYTFNVRAEYEVNGETVSRSKVIRLSTGRQGVLAFDAAPQENETEVADNKSETKLTLRVPADAKVYLAGRETLSTGELREFATTQLAPGEAWSNYTIRVVTHRNGRPVSQERTITLNYGEQKELDFGFAQADKVASAQR